MPPDSQGVLPTESAPFLPRNGREGRQWAGVVRQGGAIEVLEEAAAAASEHRRGGGSRHMRRLSCGGKQKDVFVHQ